MTEEKRARLHQALDEACDHGLGEFNIKIKEDGHFFVDDIRWRRNPLPYEMKNAFEEMLASGFGNVELIDGAMPVFKQSRKIRI